jgi:hypothetical protein
MSNCAVNWVSSISYCCPERLTDKAGSGSSSDDDEGCIGPRPPAPGDAALSAREASAREIEARARRMRDRLEGKDKQVNSGSS